MTKPYETLPEMLNLMQRFVDKGWELEADSTLTPSQRIDKLEALSSELGLD